MTFIKEESIVDILFRIEKEKEKKKGSLYRPTSCMIRILWLEHNVLRAF